MLGCIRESRIIELCTVIELRSASCKLVYSMFVTPFKLLSGIRYVRLRIHFCFGRLHVRFGDIFDGICYTLPPNCQSTILCYTHGPHFVRAGGPNLTVTRIKKGFNRKQNTHYKYTPSIGPTIDCLASNTARFIFTSGVFVLFTSLFFLSENSVI